jgi:hypothetical protein
MEKIEKNESASDEDSENEDKIFKKVGKSKTAVQEEREL